MKKEKGKMQNENWRKKAFSVGGLHFFTFPFSF
jgi:hypothetical protein